MVADEPERASFQDRMAGILGVVQTQVSDAMHVAGGKFALRPGASSTGSGEPLDDSTNDDLLFLAEGRFGPRYPTASTLERPDLSMEEINDFLSAALPSPKPFGQYIANLRDRVNADLDAGGWPHGDRKVRVSDNEWKPCPETPVEGLGFERELGWSYTLARSKALSKEWFLAKISEALMRIEHASGEERDCEILKLGWIVSAERHRIHLPKVEKAVKQVKDASKGGIAKRASLEQRNAEIVAEMAILVAQHHSVVNAARLCFERKPPLGASPGANKAVWYDQKNKAI